MMQNSIEIVYPELSFKITGLLMEAQSKLGRFCRERQYADYFEKLLQRENIRHVREKTAPFEIEGNYIQGNRVDFIAEDKILIEMKSVPFLTKRDYYQTMRYLKAANLRLGLLVNFRSEHLKPKRVLNSSCRSD